MTPSSDSFDRSRYNRTRVDRNVAIAAGSTAWSLAGRGSIPAPEHRRDLPRFVEYGDRALPIRYRN